MIVLLREIPSHLWVSHKFDLIRSATYWILSRVKAVCFLNSQAPDLLGVHAPVSPDLAKTVKVSSDHSESLLKVYGGAKNGNFS